MCESRLKIGRGPGVVEGKCALWGISDVSILEENGGSRQPWCQWKTNSTGKGDVSKSSEEEGEGNGVFEEINEGVKTKSAPKIRLSLCQKEQKSFHGPTLFSFYRGEIPLGVGDEESGADPRLRSSV